MLPVAFNASSFLLVYIFREQHSGTTTHLLLMHIINSNIASRSKVEGNLYLAFVSAIFFFNATSSYNRLVLYSNLRTHRFGQEPGADNRRTCPVLCHINHQFLREFVLNHRNKHLKCVLQVPLLVFVNNPAHLIITGLATFVVFTILIFTAVGFPYSGDLDAPKPQRFWIYVSTFSLKCSV